MQVRVPRKMPTKGAMKVMLDAIRGQKVIHVGACGQKGRLKRHKPFKDVAPDIIGFDVSKQDVKIANELGFPEIFYADATNLEHMRKIVDEHGWFPHVVMPEVIEHVTNPGMLLDGCRILMQPKGTLYLTTPYVWNFQKGVRINKDHVCWYCEKTLPVLLKKHRLYATTLQVYGKQLFAIVKRIGVKL